MVDGTGLENRHTLTGIGGSNPSLSASSLNSLVNRFNVERDRNGAELSTLLQSYSFPSNKYFSNSGGATATIT